nr:bifunctional glycosyltransferase 87/phosphatase PAP2 family protein [Streptomyces sp. TP-A0874]
MAVGAAWLLVALLAARQAAAVLRLPPERRFTDLESWIGDNGVLWGARGSLYDGGTFTGTPFSGMVLKPLTRAAEQNLGVTWTLGTLLLVVVLGVAVARALPEPLSARTARFAVPVAICLLVLSTPVRNAFSLGQTSILPVLLVVFAFLPGTSVYRTGVLVGIAAALQPVALLFAVLLWCSGRRPAAFTAAGTFAACSLLAAAVLPADSAAYWLHHPGGIGLGAPADSLANQSLHGLLLRIGLRGPAELVLFGLLAAVIVVLGLRRGVRFAADGQWLLAVALTGCVGVLVSPAAWQHQQLWILLAAVGRVGRRAADRLVWPAVVIAAMTVRPDALMPKIWRFGELGDHAPMLAALAAATLVPFVSRASAQWRSPVPTAYTAPPKARFGWVPLLGFWKQSTARPNLLLELLLIRIGYFGYSLIRGSAPDERGVAEAHGRQILDIESAMFLDVEHWFNHMVAEVSWLQASMNFYYSTFHFLVPLTLLAWMYLQRPATYRWARTALAITTLLALIGFWAYPLAPPRLMPGLGYIDTANGPQDLSDPDFGALTGISNQYAAMPSLHIGWSLWCGLVVWRLAPRLWAKLLGMAYPLLTTAVIVGTANHYILDAVGGAAVVAAGFGLRYVLAGRSVGEESAAGAPETGADDPPPEPPGPALDGPQEGSGAGPVARPAPGGAPA